MARKVVLQEEINNDEEWTNMLETPGIYVVDVYTEWCGPCSAMAGNLKRVKMELDNEDLHFAIAKSDNITALERFRMKSVPHWLFFFDGKFSNIIIGTNAPRLRNLIIEETEQYEQYKRGEIHKYFMPLNRVTEEERQASREKDNYFNQKFKKSKKLRDDRILKLRERSLYKFAQKVQLQSCVVFFPHTIEYVMVEKVPIEGIDEIFEDAEPEYVEKRVCEVANKCAALYEELVIVEAKEVQLTEDSLDELFFADREYLKNIPPEMINDLLTKKVFSVMLALPSSMKSYETIEDEDIPTDSLGNFGLIEQKLSKIVYGEGDPINPDPESFAAECAMVNDYGHVLPSLYTPNNPVSKAAALVVLFSKFSTNNGYVPTEPTPPQYVLVFDIHKADAVLPVIEDLGNQIANYGFFRDANPEKPRLLCKDPELLVTYGLDRVGDNVKLVLSVLKDPRDVNVLKFVDLSPIYTSQNSDVGIDEAIKFFPHNYDEVDGEIEAWLRQQTKAEVVNEGECLPGECGEEVFEVEYSDA